MQPEDVMRLLVVENERLAELEIARQRASDADAFHQITVTTEVVGVVDSTDFS